jgi:uncharacterized protein YkwD
VFKTAKSLAAAISTGCCLLLGIAAGSAAAHPAKALSTTAHARREVRKETAARRRRDHHRTREHRAVSLRRGVRRAGRHTVKRPVAPAAPAPRVVRPPRTAVHTRQNEAAASIAAVLAAPCANTEVTPEPANLGIAQTAVLCLVNRVRAEHGELPLIANGELQTAATEHAQELIAVDYFAHVAPDGMTPVDRVRDTGYIPNASDGYVIGENLAWGTYELSTPSEIVAAWVASPGHLANILESQYTETGIAITPAVPASLGEGAPGATYAQEFGVIIQ